MLTIDGFDFALEPITIAHLYCGCIKFYSGHEVQVDGLALCPEPGTCTGHQNGMTAIEDLIQTDKVAPCGSRRDDTPSPTQ